MTITDELSSSLAVDENSKFAIEAIATTLFSRASSSPLKPPHLVEQNSSVSALTEVNHHPVVGSAPIWRSSFQNRRDQSECLKKAFPAGFRLNAVRNELSNDPYEHMLQRAHNAGVKTVPSNGFSFVHWAKGGSSYATEFDDEMHDDPFADCAGPSLAELQKARRGLKNCSFNFVDNDPACIVRKATIENKHTASGTTLANVKTGSRSKVYHAPAVLPTLTPALGGSSSFVLNHQAGKNKPAQAQYETWLRNRQLQVNDQVWRSKGNDTQHNYSAYEFGADDVLKLKTSSRSLTSIPQPWKQEISLEIYTMKQIMKSVRSNDHNQQFMTKVLPSESLLLDLRLSIANDIVEGIKLAFPDLPALLNAPDFNLVPVQIENIDMVFTFFHEEMRCWRPLQSEADWVECKNLSTFFGRNLKIMYALEAHSEKLLVAQIQRNYELQRDLLAKKKPPISVEDLTAALMAENKRKAKRTSSEQKLSHSSSTLSPPDKSSIFVSEKSVLYPKSSATLKQLQSNSQASIKRLETFASNLEGKILKTKW